MRTGYYSLVSFYGEQADGCNLGKLVNSEDLSIGKSLFLDSAYNGRCEGMLGWRGVEVLDLVDPEYPDFCYLSICMVYFGNGAGDVMPGSCGSAIWNEDWDVAAFFRWYDQEKSIAYAPSCNVLMNAGYVLEAI
jgi:hypothetical protein